MEMDSGIAFWFFKIHTRCFTYLGSTNTSPKINLPETTQISDPSTPQISLFYRITWRGKPGQTKMVVYRGAELYGNLKQPRS